MVASQSIAEARPSADERLAPLRRHYKPSDESTESTPTKSIKPIKSNQQYPICRCLNLWLDGHQSDCDWYRPTIPRVTAGYPMRNPEVVAEEERTRMIDLINAANNGEQI